MFLNVKSLKLLSPLLGFAILLSCSGSQNEGKSSEEGISKTESSTQESANNQVEKIKTIFYNIPSPVEMSELTQRANLVYNADILNSLDKVNQYTSTSSMALNLGVYGADLSYTRLYDQIQESINYLAVIRKLSENLGVPQEDGSFAVSRLEKNINNKDSLLYIIIEVYSNADIYLKENERSGTAALIITGGWIEALHIATNIIDEENPNPEIMERIAEQKFSLENLIQLLEIQYPDKGSLEEMFTRLYELKTVYDKIELIHKPGEVITDEENKLTSINSKTHIYINFEQIKEIKDANDRLRELIIS